jgi:hypothetical protein
MSSTKVKLSVIKKNGDWQHLAFIKIIKDHTGLGLKDAKYLGDDIKKSYVNNRRTYYEIEIYTSPKELKDDLNDIGLYVDIIDRGRERDIKLTSLIGDKSDVSDTLSDIVSSDLYMKVVQRNTEDLMDIFKDYFKELLMEFNDDDLKKILAKKIENGKRVDTF